MKLKGILIIYILFILTVYSSAEQTYNSCVDKTVVTQTDTDPACNLLSIPAKEVTDPYVFAVSYFNSRLNLILRENVVSEFAYYDVPYYIYKSFMNAGSKESYWKNCIKDIYNYDVVY